MTTSLASLSGETLASMFGASVWFIDEIHGGDRVDAVFCGLVAGHNGGLSASLRPSDDGPMWSSAEIPVERVFIDNEGNGQ